MTDRPLRHEDYLALAAQNRELVEENRRLLEHAKLLVHADVGLPATTGVVYCDEGVVFYVLQRRTGEKPTRSLRSRVVRALQGLATAAREFVAELAGLPRSTALLRLLLVLFMFAVVLLAGWNALGDEPPVLLPAPPVDVTAMARAEYQKAEQDFSAGNLDGAERDLEASWRLQKSCIIQYDLALVHIKQGRLHDASVDMMSYFGFAPPAVEDAANAAAKARLRTIARMRGHAGRSGREYAKAAIAKIKAGKYDVAPALDIALDETQDLSLLYWIVLSDMRMSQANTGPKRTYKYLNTSYLGILQRMMRSYYGGATDLADVFDARKLSDEIDVAYKRAVVLEAAEKAALEVRR